MNEEEAIKQLKQWLSVIDLKKKSNIIPNTDDIQAIETALNLLEKKDEIINKIQEEVLDHIGFENRLKRDNREPDLFNQGRFYVANNINDILKGK